MKYRLVEHRKSLVLGLLWCVLIGGKAQGAVAPKASALDLAATEIRYSLVTAASGNMMLLAEADEATGQAPFTESDPKLKSPAKAFFLSLVVPGAGQWYYGSRIKPFLFLGAEAAAWGLHANFHSEGESLTDEFEAFNREHWLKDRYDSMLVWTYDVTDDDDINPLDAPEMTHHLPDTRTQQYYEMTGKYDQFAWGWDDATLRGSGFVMYSAENPPPRLFSESNVPHSENRIKYEIMRDDANNEFDKATRMIYLALTNHLLSAFEAYFMTQYRNNKATKSASGQEGTKWGRSGDDSFWSNVKVKPSLKSVHQKYDTPYVKVTYKF